MKHVFRSLTVLIWFAFAACLPQGAQTGGMVPGSSVMGAAGDTKGDSAGGNGSAGDGEAPPVNPTDVVASAGPTPMPAGTAAPTHQVPDAYSQILKGNISRDCTTPDGKTSVHAWGLIKTRKSADGIEYPYQGGALDLKVYYKKDSSETGYHILLVSFLPAPQEPGSLQALQEPLSDYFDFTVLTSDPSDLHYFVGAKTVANLFQEPPPEVGPLPSGIDEVEDVLTDASPAVPPACFEPQMMMGPAKPGTVTNDVRTKEGIGPKE